MYTPPHFIRNLALIAAIFGFQMAFSQQGVKWGTGGNSIATGDFFGTTNNFSILFKVNNIQRMSLNTTGILQLNSLAGTGTGFTTIDANGNLIRTNFPNDPNKFLNGDGTFTNISTPGAWSYNGNNLFNPNSGFVGIGTSNPQFLLDVNGNARVNGNFQVNSLIGTGIGLTSLDMNGNLVRTNFPNDPNKFLNGNGTFSTITSLGSWSSNGNNIFNPNSGYVGIGTSNPQFILDVHGDARVNGTLYAQGIVLATKMQADSMKGGSMVADTLTSASVVTATMTSTNVVAGTVKSSGMISINNNLNFTGGLQNEIYTYNGDVRMQSFPGYNGNTILNAGTTGNVGVGNISPQYKFDVSGDVRVSGKIYANRITGLPGDSLIRFGDSTLWVNYNTGSFWNGNNLHGIGIGQIALATGPHSTAIGYHVISQAINSVIIGSNITNGPVMIYNIPNSFAVGFNSNVPTFFVGEGSGPNTFGKVGVGTTNPQGDFQVGNGWASTSMGGTFGSANSPLYSSSYFGLNVAYNGLNNWVAQGNSTTNGGVAMIGTLNGTFEVVNIPTNGGSNQTFSDANMANNTFFEIRPPTTPNGTDSKVVIGQNPESILTPGAYRLYVSDGIITEKLKITTYSNWSDYVFDSTYALSPLDTVANFIQKNHHLPNIQSASDVKTTGIDVGESEASLLAKIEELFLYSIQLQKQNAAMQKEIDELKK